VFSLYYGNRPVAFKKFKKRVSESIDIRREADFLLASKHPNIVEGIVLASWNTMDCEKKNMRL
jgi:hypothetical protein